MPQRILILSDGRPGHFNLAEGIAAAIARLTPVEVARVTIRRRWPGAFVATAVALGIAPRRLLSLVYRLSIDDVPGADLIISAGAETLGANIALARERAIPNVFYGSLRRFRPEDFTLVLTSYPRNAKRPRHAVALKPSQFDPKTLPAPRPVSRAAPPRCVLVLVGGDAPGVTFDREDWDALVKALEDLHRSHGTRLIISNSRRTPAAVSERFVALAQDPAGPVKRLVDVRLPGAPRLPALLGEADAVLVTADSSSMLSEACWAGRPAIALTPRRLRLTADEASYRAWLSARGWCADMAMAAVTPERLVDAWAGLKPMAENPLDDLAALLAGRLASLRSAREA